MTTSNPKSRSQSRLVLLLLSSCFFAPMLIALALQTPLLHWRPEATKNFGQLLSPVVPLSGLLPPVTQAARGNVGDGVWTLLWLAPADCSRCAPLVRELEAIREIQGRNFDRVRLELISLAPPAMAAGWSVRVADSATLARLRFATGMVGGGVLMLDPFGNAMMRYPEDFDGTKVRKDLTRMLKTSQAGRTEPTN
jgi:hypothetical protein